MTHRDRFWDLSGRKQAACDAGGASSRFVDALRQVPEATGTAAFQSFRAASPASCDAPHHGDTGS